MGQAAPHVRPPHTMLYKMVLLDHLFNITHNTILYKLELLVNHLNIALTILYHTHMKCVICFAMIENIGDASKRKMRGF